MLERKTYKNWKEICEAMGWESTSGRYKEERKKELETLCKFHQEGNSWIIEEIYEDEIKEYYMENQNKKEIHEILTVGMVIKNYKELCELIGWEVRAGKSKKIQMSDLERFCKFHKEGNKIIIDEVYENKLEKVDLRKNGNNTIYRNKIQKLIIDMCSSDKNGIIHMSVSELMLRFNMINEDYLNDRDNIHEIGKYGEIPKKTLYDFYDSSFSNAKQNIIRTLNDLQQKGLIEYSEDFMLLFKNGERRITNEYERNIILRAEDEVVNSMNEVNKIKIFSYRKWGIFKRNV